MGTRLLLLPALGLLGNRKQPRVALRYWTGLLLITSTIVLVVNGLLITRLWWPLLWCTSSLLVLFLAMSHLEGVLQGEAPSARLIWILGWQLMWMASVLELFVYHDRTTYDTILSSISYTSIYVLAVIFLALGYYAECRRWDMGLWPYVLGTGAVLISWAVGLLFFRTLPDMLFWTWLGLGRSPS